MSTARRNGPSRRTPSAVPHYLGELGHYSLGRVNPWLGGADLGDYLYWNAGIAYAYKNVTLDLRYHHDTDLNKTECFLNTTDPRGLFTGSRPVELVRHPVHRDVSADFTASALGVFAPAA